MIEVIPAINAKTFEEIKEKIKLIEPYFDWVHLDVADGTWTKNTIWHNAQDLLELETSLNIEVHLMINDIDQRINDWLLPNVKRIIFHLSAAKDPNFVINKGKDAGKEMGIAIGPDESLLKAMNYRGRVALFQILGVAPGIAGQKIKEETFERLKELRKFCEASPSGGQSCIIEVDGGVSKENAKKLGEAGADILVAATAIFEGKIKENLNMLKKTIK